MGLKPLDFSFLDLAARLPGADLEYLSTDTTFDHTIRDDCITHYAFQTTHEMPWSPKKSKLPDETTS